MGTDKKLRDCKKKRQGYTVAAAGEVRTPTLLFWIQLGLDKMGAVELFLLFWILLASDNNIRKDEKFSSIISKKQMLNLSFQQRADDMYNDMYNDMYDTE